MDREKRNRRMSKVFAEGIGILAIIMLVAGAFFLLATLTSCKSKLISAQVRTEMEKAQEKENMTALKEDSTLEKKSSTESQNVEITEKRIEYDTSSPDSLGKYPVKSYSLIVTKKNEQKSGNSQTIAGSKNQGTIDRDKTVLINKTDSTQVNKNTKTNEGSSWWQKMAQWIAGLCVAVGAFYIIKWLRKLKK